MKEWFTRIKKSVQNRELEMTGGKSIDELTAGTMKVFKEAPTGTVLCIHGNIMGLMLKQIDGVQNSRNGSDCRTPTCTK